MAADDDADISPLSCAGSSISFKEEEEEQHWCRVSAATVRYKQHYSQYDRHRLYILPKETVNGLAFSKFNSTVDRCLIKYNQKRNNYKHQPQRRVSHIWKERNSRKRWAAGNRIFTQPDAVIARLSCLSLCLRASPAALSFGTIS